MKCPFCANDIKEWAIKCPYCEEFIKREEDEKDKKMIKNMKGNKSILVILGILIIILVVIIITLIVKLQGNSDTGIFEKKKICANMLNEYDAYLRDTRDWKDDSWKYSNAIWDVAMFYSSSYDSCIWAYDIFSVEDWKHSRWYVISDYMNWNNEILRCSNDRDPLCYHKRKEQVDYLKK